MRYVIGIEGREYEVTLEGSAVRVGDMEADARIADVEGTPVRLVTIGDRVHAVVATRGQSRGRYTIRLGGFRIEVEALDERTRAIRQLAGAAAKSAGPAPLTAPMPGLVVRVLVTPGDRVQAGQSVVVIEAMKMENELRAPGPAVVRGIAVRAGSAVEKGALLVEFDPTP